MPPHPTIDHLAVVRTHRAAFPTDRPLGHENAWKVVNAVACDLRARGEDAGLHRKSGTNWLGYSTDTIAYLTRQTFDCLIDAEGKGTPTWRLSGTGANFALPIDCGTTPEPPEPPEPPPSGPACDPAIVPLLRALVRDLEAVKADVRTITQQVTRTWTTSARVPAFGGTATGTSTPPPVLPPEE